MATDKQRKIDARKLAAAEGISYTAALRRVTEGREPAEPDGGVEIATVVIGESPAPGEPDADPFGGHVFEYESHTDLFRCTECQVYEVVARKDDPIAPCKGLAGYGGDTERVYLLLTENPRMPRWGGTGLAWQIRETGIGRSPRFAWRDGKLLVESAPSVVDELARKIEGIVIAVKTPFGEQQVTAVTSIERLTAEEGRAVIAANRAAYVAQYGEPE